MERRLTRSRDAMIGGVAAGVANWLNADASLVRIAWALLVPLTGGLAFVLYIVGWIIIPEEPPGIIGATTQAADPATPDAAAPGATTTDVGQPAREPASTAGDRTALVVGGVLVLIGVWFLIREFIPAIDWDLLWPLLLVVVGGAILVVAGRRR